MVTFGQGSWIREFESPYASFASSSFCGFSSPPHALPSVDEGDVGINTCRFKSRLEMTRKGLIPPFPSPLTTPQTKLNPPTFVSNSRRPSSSRSPSSPSLPSVKLLAISSIHSSGSKSWGLAARKALTIAPREVCEMAALEEDSRKLVRMAIRPWRVMPIQVPCSGRARSRPERMWVWGAGQKVARDVARWRYSYGGDLSVQVLEGRRRGCGRGDSHLCLRELSERILDVRLIKVRYTL